MKLNKTLAQSEQLGSVNTETTIQPMVHMHHIDKTKQEAIQAFNALIANARDTEAGYRSAADCIKDIELQEFFITLANRRALMIEALDEEVCRLDGQPKESPTLGGALHRGWMNLRTLFARNGIAAVLAECESAEDRSVELYEKTLKETTLDAIQRDLVSSQAALVLEMHNQVKALRDHPAYRCAS